MDSHKKKLERALAAISAVFSDTSVGKDVTEQSLLELQEEISLLQEALESGQGR